MTMTLIISILKTIAAIMALIVTVMACNAVILNDRYIDKDYRLTIRREGFLN